MASVPARYIKDKVVDYDGEIFACLNLPLEMAGLKIRPPSFLVFSLLETVDSLFIKDFSKCDAMDICRALYIAVHVENCAGDVKAWIEAGGKTKFKADKPDTWLAWDKKISDWADENKLEKLALSDFVNFRNFLIANSFTGYEMIPDTGGGSYMPYLFGAETMASVVITAGYEAIWKMPMCLVGHMAACKARSNGVKGIDRPKDEQDIKLQLKLACERETKGELHPWQIKEPDQYGPTEEQIKARPEVKTEWNTLLKAHLRAKREKETAANG